MQRRRTSDEDIGGTDLARRSRQYGFKTGFWLEEFSAPYYALKEAGAEVTLASPFGRQPPVEPSSEFAAWQPMPRGASRQIPRPNPNGPDAPSACMASNR